METKTIKKIIKYNFSVEEKTQLFAKKIINWCWWKWWYNFEEDFKRFIEAIPNFLHYKAESFFRDVKELCLKHDFDFYIWWNIFDFYLANFRFAKWVFVLMNWAKLRYRILWFLIIFISLTIYGKKYFNFIKK